MQVVLHDIRIDECLEENMRCDLILYLKDIADKRDWPKFNVGHLNMIRKCMKQDWQMKKGDRYFYLHCTIIFDNNEQENCEFICLHGLQQLFFEMKLLPYGAQQIFESIPAIANFIKEWCNRPKDRDYEAR